MAGFSTVDQAFARRDQAARDKERLALQGRQVDVMERTADVQISSAEQMMNLRETAEGRAQFIHDQAIEAQARQEQTAPLAARLAAAGGDMRSLSAEEQEQVIEAAKYNPQITQMLHQSGTFERTNTEHDRRIASALRMAEEAQQRQNAELISALEELQGLSAFYEGETDEPPPSLIEQMRQAQADNPDAQIVPGEMAFGPDSGMEMPAGPATDRPREVSLSKIAEMLPEGEREAVRSQARRQGRGLARANSQFLPGQGIQVPDSFMTMDQIQELPAHQAQQVLDQQREQLRSEGALGELGEQAAAPRREVTSATKALKAFSDVTNEDGAALRRQAAEDPAGFAQYYFNNRNSMPENERRALDVEVLPIIDEALGAITTQMRELITEGGGLVNASAPEARQLRTRLNQTLRLEQEITGEYNPARDAGIRAAGLPINHPQLTQAAFESIQNAPISAAGPPGGNGRLRAGMTQLTRFNNSNERRIPESLLRQLPVLMNAGVVTPTQVQSLLTTGQLQEGGGMPELMSFNPDHDIMIQDQATGMPVLLRPGRDREPRGTGTGTGRQTLRPDGTPSHDFGSDQWEYLKDRFETDETWRTGWFGGGSDADKEMRGFMMFIDRQRPTLNHMGFEVDDLRQMPRTSMERLYQIYRTDRMTSNAYDSRWMGMARMFGRPVSEDMRLRGHPAHQELTPERAQFAAEHGFIMPQLPTGQQVDLQGLRQALAQSDNPQDRMLARYPDSELLIYAEQQSEAQRRRMTPQR